MPKSTVSCNDVCKFIAYGTAMPSYGANWQLNFHTSDPGVGGNAGTNKPTPTNYAPVSVVRSAASFVVCDPDGTPNANGTALKTIVDVVFPEIESGFAGTETWRFASLSVVGATGQIWLYGALTQDIIVSALSTPRMPAGSVIFKEV